MSKFRPLITRILIMTASGFLLVYVAGTYTPASRPAPSQPAVAAQDIGESGDMREQLPHEAGQNLYGRTGKSSWPVKIMDALNRLTETASSVLSGRNRDGGDGLEPSVLRYNLMTLYPEEPELSVDHGTASEQDRVMRLLAHNLKPFYEFFNLSPGTRAYDSYGGRMYEYLNRKEAEWTSELYRWIQAAPEQAAAMKGLPATAVTGKFDPTNEKHDPANPATWTIPAWKNVELHFYDGDGRETETYSNAKEILSMASVHTWYTGWQDVDYFRDYIDELWRHSHSYGVSVGAVYYCGGCVDPNEEALETAPVSLAGDSASFFSEGREDADNASPEAPKAASPSELSGPADESAAGSVPGMGEGKPEDIETAGGVTESDTGEPIPLPEIELNSEGKFCPGHVDLSVTARITGLSGGNNLYQADRKGGVKTEYWEGWSDYNRAYVERLSSRDWALDYNLSAMEPAFGKPLTFTEISEYLNLLPADISRERKAVITFALHSVGKVPYYYGGKARTAGYEGNQFATITKPDRKGRILSGLDCSGWVNWVYWSSLGTAPSALGTSGLIHTGRAVSRSELKPGDIVIRLGADSHVVMFLAWAPGDQMICIHETGGSISNVTVSVADARYPYYRALLD